MKVGSGREGGSWNERLRGLAPIALLLATSACGDTATESTSNGRTTASTTNGVGASEAESGSSTGGTGPASATGPANVTGSENTTVSGRSMGGSSGPVGGSTGVEGTTTGDPGGLTPHEFASAFAMLQCGNIYRCCNNDELAAFAADDTLFVGTDVETCDSRNEEVRLRMADMVAEREAAGTVRFDPGAAQDCLDRYAEVGCADFQSFECGEIVPLLETGAECQYDFECVEGTCLLDSAVVSGRCGPPGSVGDECKTYWDCENGWCDTLEGDNVCADSFDNGEYCQLDMQCKSTFCDGRLIPRACAESHSTCWINH